MPLHEEVHDKETRGDVQETIANILQDIIVLELPRAVIGKEEN